MTEPKHPQPERSPWMLAARGTSILGAVIAVSALAAVLISDWRPEPVEYFYLVFFLGAFATFQAKMTYKPKPPATDDDAPPRT